MKIIPCLLFVLISFNAWGDILFFNFNQNGSSIAAAKKAATKRGENVIVYPNERIKKLTPETLNEILKELDDKKINISNIVMSGHDGGGHFAGKDGDISKVDLAKAMVNYPNISASVKSLLLRGCYSATMSQVQSQEASDWRIVFPNLQFVAGYSDAAESSEKAQSKEFVEDMLTLEGEFLQAKGVKNVSQTFKKLGLYNQMNAAVWMKPCNECELNKADQGVYVTSSIVRQNLKPVSISDEQTRCVSISDKLNTHVRVILSYFTGEEEGFERPPREHQGTDLRSAYTFLRQNEHCMPILIPEHAEAFNPDRVIRLIYFDYIVSNFMDNYPSGPITQILQNNFPASIQDQIKYPDLKTASRKQILAYISLLEAAAIELYKTGKDENSSEVKAAKKLFMHAQLMNISVGSLMPFHVPFSWVSEPHAGVPLAGVH